VLADLLTSDERSRINAYFDKSRGRHPAWSIMNAYCKSAGYDPSPKDYLANQAIECINQKRGNEGWLRHALTRIAQTSDFEEASSAIAEICCYGAMHEGGFALRPIQTKKNTPTPDFEFSLEETSGVVEVAAKLEHNEQVNRAHQIATGENLPGVDRSKFKVGGLPQRLRLWKCTPLVLPILIS
jgi:hypothetical protein